MRYRYQSNETIYDISIERQGDIYRATLEGETFDLEILDKQPGQLDLLFAGRPLTLYWANDGDRKWVSLDGCPHLLEKPSPKRSSKPGEISTNRQIRSPMPAQVQDIRAVDDEAVEKGQILLMLEAMKMEIRIQAPYAGKIKHILVKKGQTVQRDQALIEMEEPD
jgi:acetyl/propionyl-CoA carboxylase alpha subunit